MVLEQFTPLVRQWFTDRFGSATDPQVQAWPAIAAGKHTLVAAPTGSGKTLAAFLVCLDQLVRQWQNGTLTEQTQVVYLSPLKALSNDIERNLQQPLAELANLAREQGLGELPIRVAVRTGDTPASERQSMLRHPPHILVTTPESIYLLLTSVKGRGILTDVRTVIVDEIHALARDKRGSHLSLTLERLAAHTSSPLQRIGLSATQRPMDAIARFLVGRGKPLPPAVIVEKKKRKQKNSQPLLAHLDDVLSEAGAPLSTENAGGTAGLSSSEPSTTASPPNVQIVDSGHIRNLDLAISVPPSELAAVCSNEQWEEVYAQLSSMIQSHRSTLVFVNTRRLAERISHRLTELLGEEAVASHHGSLSRQIRLDAEQRLKAGKLRAIVATASLEMGIDIGYIDLVCQIGSPRSIATFLQRVGRSGHNLGATPKGRLFPLTRDELLECLALVQAVRRGELDEIEIPQQPLDILAQQVIAMVAAEDMSEDDVYALVTRAEPYHQLSREVFDKIVHMVSTGIKQGRMSGGYVHRDQIHHMLRARRGARIAAITSGGAIPEQGEYRVVVEGEGTFVGTVDEDFAIDSMVGNIFLLGNNSWQIRQIKPGEVVVADVHGAPPTIPHWFGEAPGRTIELSRQLSTLRQELSEQISDQQIEIMSRAQADGIPSAPEDLAAQLMSRAGCDAWGAEQAIRYIAAQKAAVGLVPTIEKIIYERFFDESGGMQLVIHAALGSRINRAWGLALRKRFCRSFDFELQAAADDNGVLLSIGPQHSFPIDSLFGMLHPGNAQELLEQAILAVPMFQIRWRWNATRALAVLRQQGGKRVPPHLQKFRSEDLLATTFPETVGCLENHHGDIVVPDHPLVQQTMHDCLTEAMDIVRWTQVLADIKSGKIELIARDTREPSPFAHQMLNARPYAFLDDAGLEERRTRAISTRRSLSIDDYRDLTRLDPAALSQVSREAWPTIRDGEELHDALVHLVLLLPGETERYERMLEKLAKEGRAAAIDFPVSNNDAVVDSQNATKPLGKAWFAAERWPVIQAVYGNVPSHPQVQLPEALCVKIEPADGRVELVRGRMQHSGPITASQLAESIGLGSSQVFAALEAVEAEGLVMRGNFTAPMVSIDDPTAKSEVEWCERRLLSRVHKLTLDGLKRRIEAVPPETYIELLIERQGLSCSAPREGLAGLREAVLQLQGFEAPAGAWEEKILAARVKGYDPQWLDHLYLSGELLWGRICPPDRETPSSAAALSRAMPLTMLGRDDRHWLLQPPAVDAQPMVTPRAAEVLHVLGMRGALFFAELLRLTGLLASELETALAELSAAGLASCDTFAAVRYLAGTAKKTSSRNRQATSSGPIGRWTLFPGSLETPSADDVAIAWCKQLLRRYGVVFRDLLARESAAPPWGQLVRLFRRLELRGEVRGGRFIAGVAGEQFAEEAVVGRLRDLRDQPTTDWTIVSAVDPLNLSGVVTEGPRIAALHKNAIVIHRGRAVAAKVSGRIEFFGTVDPHLQVEMRRALQLGKRPIGEPKLHVHTPKRMMLPDPQQLDSRRRMGW